MKWMRWKWQGKYVTVSGRFSSLCVKGVSVIQNLYIYVIFTFRYLLRGAFGYIDLTLKFFLLKPDLFFKFVLSILPECGFQIRDVKNFKWNYLWNWNLNFILLFEGRFVVERNWLIDILFTRRTEIKTLS